MNQKFTPPTEINIENLFLDPENPRIPKEKRLLSQDDLIIYVANTYNSLAIAQSITSHEYFPSEPLIAMPLKGVSGGYIVLEGNRRLAALKLLKSSGLRKNISNKNEWDILSSKKFPEKIPVVKVKNRREVAPIIGYRHISGIQPWDAYSKARYIAAQVDGGLNFKQTAIEVGERESEVKSNYRNYRIAEQFSRSGSDTEEYNGMMTNFGVFTRAMQSKDLRDFIGAPQPDEVSNKKLPVPEKKKPALKELMGFLFGPNAVIGESREITKLGKIISSSEGLKALRSERNLEMAHVASGGLFDRLLSRLDASAKNLRAAKEDIHKYKSNTDVKKLFEECKEAVKDIENALK